MPKIVVYYRSSRPQFYNFTAVTALQQMAIESWANAAEESNDEFARWKIIRSFYENYRGRDGSKKSDLPKLDTAIALCEEEGASLVYIEMRMWRPNPFIDDKIDDFIRRNGKKKVIVIPSSGDDGAFEIRNYFLRKSEKRKQLKRKKERGRRISAGIAKAREARGTHRDPKDLRKAQSRGGKMKRARSLYYLGHITDLILTFEGQKYTNQKMADLLNERETLSVSGKEWTSASISKARTEIHTPGFRDRVVAAMNFISPEYDSNQTPLLLLDELPN